MITKIIIIALLVIILAINLFLIVKLSKSSTANGGGITEADKKEIKSSFSDNISFISYTLDKSSEKSYELLKAQLESFSQMIQNNNSAINDRLTSVEKSQENKLEHIRTSLERNVENMQRKNDEKLSEIQKTVDERLSKTLNDRFNDSFKILSDELEKVNKTIGEMQKISSDVGTLTKVLSGVKTTGIFGETQLGAIIDQILTPEQYVKNVVTNKDSRDPVEFAVKMPGTDGNYVYLPIDAKFPYTVYVEMQNAYEANDFITFEAKRKQLHQTVKNMAKDIKDKYVCPPQTTNFGIMFLPSEGLFSEIAKSGLINELQQKYNVTVAGPTTIATLLNSLSLGFQTLSIQKKSGEVWKILSEVKKEFAKFNELIESVRKRLSAADKDLDQLVGVRTRAIDRSLRSVTEIKEEQNGLETNA